MRTLPINRAPVNLSRDDFFAIDGTFGNDLTVRSANEALPPKFDSGSAYWRLVAHAIGGGDVTTVGDGVTALDRFPRGMLRFAEFLSLAGVPADRGRIENDFGAA